MQFGSMFVYCTVYDVCVCVCVCVCVGGGGGINIFSGGPQSSSYGPRRLITIWSIGVASRGLNELFFVKT